MNSPTYDRKHAAMMRKLRIVQGMLKSLRVDLFGAIDNGATPQARFADQLLSRLDLVRGHSYPEEEITTRLRQSGFTDPEERIRFKIELEEMGMIEGNTSQSTRKLKAQASHLRPRLLTGLDRYGVDDSQQYTERELDELLKPWNLDPTVRSGLKTEASVRGLLRR